MDHSQTSRELFNVCSFETKILRGPIELPRSSGLIYLCRSTFYYLSHDPSANMSTSTRPLRFYDGMLPRTWQEGAVVVDKNQ
jgi:hypothetical protein